MLIKIFTLRFSERIEGFDDEPVRAFMADKEVVAVNERFFIKDGVPYWTVMLKYKPASDAKTEAPATETARQERKTDPRDILKDADMPLYNRLRDWRNERARKDGVPPYVVFNNKQVAEIAVKRPRSLNQLSAIKGVGQAKIEKYGQAVIGIISPITEGQQTMFPEDSPDKAPDALTEGENGKGGSNGA